jgi:NRAMP (natural resistance-associated macrophage protein)-like metal ion transporter
VNGVESGGAALDAAHVGDIEGAFGTIRLGDEAPRAGLKSRLMTLLAVVGPGLIVMVGDNDAGAFGTYAQAGQNYGTDLLWVLLLLVPVLYINQEMVLRLGVVAGVGHARLILERFGKFWGAFSVIDLFILNALTIVTEFIGISLGLDYLGLPKVAGVLLAGLVIIAAASTGSFRRFERVCMVLVVGSLLLIPILVMVHPTLAQVARGLVVPTIPAGSDASKVVLLIIGMVGTTIAPWQLFFQQSYLIDKRITPRFMNYERVDLWIGIVVVLVGATAIIAFTAATFAGHKEFGNFTDAGGVALGLEHYVGKAAGVLFAVALIDASIIGAAAVGLSTSYALGDVLGLKHSLHRKISDAKGFYAAFVGILIGSAVIVLIPGSPLGLLTAAVQVLAGVLLPSATVFLLILCNDAEVVGPWINGRAMNLFTGAIIAVLVILSLVLTASVLYPDLGAQAIVEILIGGAALSVVIGGTMLVFQHLHPGPAPAAIDPAKRLTWRMPPLALLAAPKLSLGSRVGLAVMRSYLLIAMIMVGFRTYQLAVGR